MREFKSSRSMLMLVLALAIAGGAGAASATATAAAPTIVSLGFDDGYTSQYAVRSTLASHGMHGTFFMISGNVGTSGFMTWPQLAALEADGNEIGGHTVDHVDLTTVSAAVAHQEVCDDRAALQAHGLHITDFAYPYGNANAQAEQAVSDCGYDSARTTLWFGSTCPSPCTESIPPRDAFATTVVGFSDQTLAELKTVVTNAEAKGGWAQIVIHQICDSGCAISPATFDALLGWLASRVTAGAIAVKTVHEVMAMPPPLPDTSITGGPSGLTKSASPSFSFTSDASTGVTYSCRLDGPGGATGSWGGCTSPKGYASLAGGSYTFRVRASNAGGLDPTPASRSFTVDATAPAAPVISVPADGSWNASGTVVLSGTAEAHTTVEVFDGASSKGTTAADGVGSWSKTLNGVADGSHVYAVTASDPAGNTSMVSSARTVKVDTVAPAVPVIGSPVDGSWNTSGTVALSGTAEANGTVEVFEGDVSEGTASTDETGAWSKTVGGLPDGARVFAVTASDAAGNVSDRSDVLTVKVDTVAPDSSITAGPSGVTADASGIFVFAGSPDAASYECALDGAAFAPCASPLQSAALASGVHTFAVRARDAAGNTDATPAVRTWSVEPPAATTTPSSVAAPLSVTPVAPPVGAVLPRPRPTLHGVRLRRTTRRRVSVRFVTDAAGMTRVALVRCSRGSGDCRRYAVVSRTRQRVAAGPVTVGLRTPVLRPGAYRVRVVVRDAGGGDSVVAQVALVVRDGYAASGSARRLGAGAQSST